MSDPDDDARRIAERGRDALIARLRPAFREAAEAHGGDIGLDDAQLEQMVQRAADEADALQWRRALAAVAMDELGLELGEALEHPAVVRAHEIVGAPAYEEAVADLGLPPPEPAERQGGEEFRPSKPDTRDPQEGPFPASSDPAAARQPLQLVCTHLGGIADLASGEQGVELCFSEHGLDIIRPTKEPLGRLRWNELRAVEVVDARGRLMLRRGAHTYVVIRGARGDASFEVPGTEATELRERLADLAGHKVPID